MDLVVRPHTAGPRVASRSGGVQRSAFAGRRPAEPAVERDAKNPCSVRRLFDQEFDGNAHELFSGTALVDPRQPLYVLPAEKLPRFEAGQAPHVLHGDELEAGLPMPGHARKGYGTANQAKKRQRMLGAGELNTVTSRRWLCEQTQPSALCDVAFYVKRSAETHGSVVGLCSHGALLRAHPTARKRRIAGAFESSWVL